MKRNRLKYHSLLAPQDWMPPANFKGSKRSWLILLAQNQTVVYFSFCDFFFSSLNERKHWGLDTDCWVTAIERSCLLCCYQQYVNFQTCNSCSKNHVSHCMRAKVSSVAPICSVVSDQIQIITFAVCQSVWTCFGEVWAWSVLRATQRQRQTHHQVPSHPPAALHNCQ